MYKLLSLKVTIPFFVLSTFLYFFSARHTDYFTWRRVWISQQGPLPPPKSCKELPGAQDVFVVLKSGARRTRSILPTYLNTTLSCVPRFAIYSDLEDNVQGQPVFDALAGYQPEVYDKYPEFETYKMLKEQQEQGTREYGSISSAPDGATKEDAPGWKLDKWKFLPLLEKVAEEEAKWYFFMEIDTHLVWSNLLSWLGKLDHTKEWYLGSLTFFGDHPFAHGGTGYVLSRAAVLKAAQALQEDPEYYEKVVADDCCGDSVVSTVMEHVGISITSAWPMLQGETVSSLDYSDNMWCYPVVTQHHVTPEQINAMWDFEQDSLKNGTGQHTIMHRDVFRNFFEPVAFGRSTRVDWDNLSKDEEYTTQAEEQNSLHTEAQLEAPNSPSACRNLCSDSFDCVQFSFTEGSCKLGHALRMGQKIDKGEGRQDVVSGWMQDRVKDFIKRMPPCSAQWILQPE